MGPFPFRSHVLIPTPGRDYPGSSPSILMGLVPNVNFSDFYEKY